MKRLMALLMALALLGISAGCGAAEDPAPGTGETQDLEGTLNLHLGGEPPSIDPAFATAGAGGAYAVQLFEGLTTLDKDLEVTAGAAANWTVGIAEDGLPLYTFSLREDAKWSDGRAVTAQDFVFAWRRAADPATRADSAYLLYPIRGARQILEGTVTQGEDGTAKTEYLKPEELGVFAVDEHTLEVTLEGPCPYFLQLLTLPVFFPVREDAVEKSPLGWTGTPETCLSNGPYKLGRWNHDCSMTMERSELYWGDTQESPRVLNFVLSQDDGALFQDFESGRLLLAGSYPPVERDALKEAGTLAEVPMLGTYYYAFNTQKEPWDKPELRRAVALALDRRALADTGDFGRLAAAGLVPPGVPDREPGGDFRAAAAPFFAQDPQQDLDLAKTLLAEAGYPGGTGLPALTFLTNDTPGHVEMANLAAGMLEENLGITVNVRALGWEQFQAAKAEGEWDLVRGGTMGVVRDAYAFLDAFVTGSPQNDGLYTSEAYDAAVAGSRAAEEPEERLPATPAS